MGKEMPKVKYYAKENSTIGTHSFYAVPTPNGKSDEAHRKLHALGIKDYTELAITEIIE